jgi:hypothetical protein
VGDMTLSAACAARPKKQPAACPAFGATVALAVMAQLAQAFSFLHDAGIVHR